MQGNISHVPEFRNFTRDNYYYYLDVVLTVSTCAFLFFTLIVGIAANLFVAWAVKHQKSLQTSNNALLVNLAVIDFLRCAIDCPLILAIFLKGNHVDQLGFSLCNAQFVSFSVTCCVQLLTLACISVERYQAIAHPFQLTERRTRVMIWIPSTWLLAIISTFPCLLFVRDSPVYVRCKGLDVQTLVSYDTYGMYFLIPLWSICLIVIMGFYGRIFVLVRAHTRKIFDKGTVLTVTRAADPTVTTTTEDDKHTVKEIVKIVPEVAIINQDVSQTQNEPPAIDTLPIDNSVPAKSDPGDNASDKTITDIYNIAKFQDDNLNSTQLRSLPKHEALVLEDVEKSEDFARASSQNQLPNTIDSIPADGALHADAEVTSPQQDRENQDDDNGAVCMMPPRFNADRAKKNKEGKLAKRSGYIIFTFLAFWTPFIITILTNYFIRKHKDHRMEIALEIEILTISLVCMTSVTNPIIYAVVNPQFRTEFQNLRSKLSSAMIRSNFC